MYEWATRAWKQLDRYPYTERLEAGWSALHALYIIICILYGNNRMPYFSVAGIVVGPSLQLLFSIGSSTNNDYYNKTAHFSPHFSFFFHVHRFFFHFIAYKNKKSTMNMFGSVSIHLWVDEICVCCLFAARKIAIAVWWIDSTKMYIHK